MSTKESGPPAAPSPHHTVFLSSPHCPPKLGSAHTDAAFACSSPELHSSRPFLAVASYVSPHQACLGTPFPAASYFVSPSSTRFMTETAGQEERGPSPWLQLAQWLPPLFAPSPLLMLFFPGPSLVLLGAAGSPRSGV